MKDITLAQFSEDIGMRKRLERFDNRCSRIIKMLKVSNNLKDWMSLEHDPSKHKLLKSS